MKKILVVIGIVVLFVGASAVPSISGSNGEMNNSSTILQDDIYVDDDSPCPGGDNQDNYPLMNPLVPYLADYDVGVSSIDGLYSGPAGVFTPEVSVTNFGQLPVCCFQVNLQIEKVNATLEYNETLCVSEDIDPGETVILTFPDWTPEDLQYGISGSIDYNVTACTRLIDDQIPINDAFTMSITLEYFHDVRVKQITKPVVTGFEPQWIHFDDGIYNTAIGLTAGGTYEAAIRITPDELEDLDGYTLTSVKFYHHVTSGTNEIHSGNIKIYEAGTASEPGTLITSEPYTVSGEGWFDVNLSESVTLDVSEDIWVSVEVTHEPGEHPIGCDDGLAIDGKGDWIAIGGDWSELQDYDLDYNWLIHAFVEYPGEPYLKLGTHEVEAIVDNIGVFPESNLIVTAKIFKDGNLTYESNYTVTSLDVGEEETALFDDWTVTESGMYTLEININLTNDDYPENNTESVDIGADGEAPVSNHILDPATPDGDNDWYVSDVTVNLSATDGTEPWQSGVDYIEYKVDGGSVQTGDSVTVTTDGSHTVEYRAVDNVGNEESWNLVEFKIDQTPPEIDLTVEKIGPIKYKFTANVSDAMSGINRVEFYYADELLGTVTESPYEWIYLGAKGQNATAIVYDNAGNSAEDEKPVSYSSYLVNQQVRVITKIVQQTLKQNIASIQSKQSK